MLVIRFGARRLLQAVPTLALATVIVFGLVNLAPGDPTSVLLGADFTEETRQALRKELGLDQPLPIQYMRWVTHAVTGDLGTSVRTKEPVTRMIAQRLTATLTLAVLALALAIALAIPVGIVSAVRRNSVADYVAMGSAVLALSVPSFVLGILLILLFAVQLQILPISGYVDPIADPFGAVPFLVMPVTTLAASRAAVLARLVRAGMLEVLRKDYMRTARSKGLPERTVLLRHGLRNGLVPVITVVAIHFGYLIGGAIVIEQIFGISGIGSLLLAAVQARDYPVIQGVTLVAALFFIGGSFVADVLHASVDPRIHRA